ncbi:MAG: sugar transferase [Chloroflexi bacterium]|nr:sugar transferase [Chloroflexota bacterium]
MKRLFDFAFSFLLLIALLPFFLVVAIAIKLGSPGPVFYRWKVVGRRGRPFTGYKFRTMVEGADELKLNLTEQNEMIGPVFKLNDDPRITPFGKFLRKYSLDEFPQLWSVIKGDMSLVGPRPPLQSEYRQFTEWQKQKLLVKPGITCLWQINGRNKINDFDHWVELDLKYIRERSFWLDLKILAKTIPVVLRGTGQ